MRTGTTAVALPLLLAACAAPLHPETARRYQCSDGTRFTVRGGGEQVELILNGERLLLPRVRSGTGRKYTDRRLLLWEREEGRAVLATGGHGMLRCRALP